MSILWTPDLAEFDILFNIYKLWLPTSLMLSRPGQSQGLLYKHNCNIFRIFLNTAHVPQPKDVYFLTIRPGKISFGISCISCISYVSFISCISCISCIFCVHWISCISCISCLMCILCFSCKSCISCIFCISYFPVFPVLYVFHVPHVFPVFHVYPVFL